VRVRETWCWVSRKTTGRIIPIEKKTKLRGLKSSGRGARLKVEREGITPEET